MINQTKILRRTTLRAVSKRRDALNKEYMAKRKAFLASNPLCMYQLAEGVARHACNKATEIHHVCGRAGAHFLDEGTWMAVCRKSHRFIHDHPKLARAKGYLK